VCEVEAKLNTVSFPDHKTRRPKKKRRTLESEEEEADNNLESKSFRFIVYVTLPSAS
jgi:hypothetical protein